MPSKTCSLGTIKAGLLSTVIFTTSIFFSPAASAAVTYPNVEAREAVKYAKAQLGDPWVYAARGPDSFDCSGLTWAAYNSVGINLNSSSYSQFRQEGTKHIARNNLLPGDLVYFAGSDGSLDNPGHVGIYIGNGRFIESPAPGGHVQIRALNDRSDYAGATRPTSLLAHPTPINTDVTAFSADFRARGIAIAPAHKGYWILQPDGGIFTFGGAPFYGAASRSTKKNPATAIAATSTGRGYWILNRNGSVHGFGDAKPKKARARISGLATGIAGHSNNGFWVLGSDGSVHNYGKAKHLGGAKKDIVPFVPAVAIAATSTGNGYWVMSYEGGIYTFGDAKFAGGMNKNQHKLIYTGLASFGTKGYYILRNDGRVFPKRAPTLRGEKASANAEAVGITMKPGGKPLGYWLVTVKGRIYARGSAKNHGGNN